MVQTREEEIAAKVSERFKEKYPNSYKRIVESDACFVSWCVNETLKELEDEVS